MKPTKTRIALKVLDIETISPGGIILPLKDRYRMMDEKTLTGEVFAIGPNVLDVKVGDKVCYWKYKGYEVEENECLIIKEEDVLCVLE